MNAWHALDFDTRKSYELGYLRDQFEAAIAKFNGSFPLSPSVSGESSDNEEVEGLGVTEWRAIQRWNRCRRDFRKRPEENTLENSKHTFPFLKLPVEIRHIVYRLHIKRESPVI